MHTAIFLILTVGLAAPAAAGDIDLDINVSVTVEAQITDHRITHTLENRRLQCSGGAIRIIQDLKVLSIVQVEAIAEAEAEADSSYQEFCGNGEEAYGSDSESASNSATDDQDEDQEKLIEVTIALVSQSHLAKRNFSISDGCEVLSSDGTALNSAKAFAVINWIYGEEQMKDQGADLDAVLQMSRERNITAPSKISVPF